MTRHDDTVYLRHMLEHARDAVAIALGKKREDLDADRTLRYALLHVDCITGEAAARVSEAGRSSLPSIPWKQLVGMRNRLIHGYDTADMEVLWTTVMEDFPALIKALDRIVEN